MYVDLCAELQGWEGWRARAPAELALLLSVTAQANSIEPWLSVRLVRSCQEAVRWLSTVRRCQVGPCQAVVRSVRLERRVRKSRPVRPCQVCQVCQLSGAVRCCQACQVCQLSGAVRPVRRCQAVRPVRTRLGHNHLTTSTQIITTPLMDTPTLHPHEFFVHHLFLYINSSWRFRSAIATPPAASGGDTL